MTALQLIVGGQVQTELDDDQIKLLARHNRRAAVDAVVRKYRNRLVSHAMYVLKDANEAFDVIQEVFIKSMREPRFFDEEFKMKAWLFRVTSNLCFNQVRDRRRRSIILESVPRTLEPETDALTALFADEQQRKILLAIDEVSEEHREVLMLRYYSDLSYAEIADTLGVKLGTVMSRLSRAKTRLMEVIDASGCL